MAANYGKFNYLSVNGESIPFDNIVENTLSGVYYPLFSSTLSGITNDLNTNQNFKFDGNIVYTNGGIVGNDAQPAKILFLSGDLGLVAGSSARIRTAGDFIPATGNAYNIGSDSVKYGDGFFNGVMTVGSLTTSTQGTFDISGANSIKLYSLSGDTLWTSTSSTGYWQTVGLMTAISARLTWTAKPANGGALYLQFPFTLDNVSSGSYGGDISVFTGITFAAGKGDVCLLTRNTNSSYADIYFSSTSGGPLDAVIANDLSVSGTIGIHLLCRKN